MSEEERNYEAEARKEGWVPQDEWNGPDDKWKPAQQFVEDGEKIVPILKSKVDRLENRIDEVLTTNQKLNEFHQQSLAKERKAKEELIKELEQVRQQAVTEGDGEAFTRADSQLNELRGGDNYMQQQLDPMAEQWLSNNQWYTQNFELGAYADGLADRLRDMGYSGQAYYDELTKRVKERFPDEFGNKNRQRASSVETGGAPDVDSKSRTFDNLPDEAKKAYERFKRDVPGFTKKQYVEQYDWETL